MKKSFFFVAALALVFASCENTAVPDSFVATFEEAEISPVKQDSIYKADKDTTIFLKSGAFKAEETVSWAGASVAGAVISNIKGTSKKGLEGAYYATAGGPHRGRNFMVWYADAWAPNTIKLTSAAVVPGMYVCNNMYAYASMTEGDAYAGEPFGDEDWFKLTIGGKLNGQVVNTKVDFMLAEGTSIVKNWTYVDLSTLGEVDELTFEMTGSRTGDWGLNTPSYFCVDDLGAKR